MTAAAWYAPCASRNNHPKVLVLPVNGESQASVARYGAGMSFPGKPTKYCSTGLHTLFALVLMGSACDRTYQRVGDVNVTTVEAWPFESTGMSRVETSRHAPPKNS